MVNTYNRAMPASFLPPPPSWLADAIGAAQPPDWLVQEMQLKLVLFLNHVLQANPHALPRTRRLSGRSVQIRWQRHALSWAFTPAGLLDVRSAQAQADLTLDLGQVSPVDLATQLMRGERPHLRIEGDVQMAAEVNWLVDHVRWSPEEDLARLLGDAPARAVFQLGQRAVQALRRFAPAPASQPGAAQP
jgi:ubiquinone biosynthesis accessory factor UbiJ